MLRRISRSLIFLVLTIGVLAGFGPAAGVETEVRPYDPSLPAKTHCIVAIDRLHPTQCAVGYIEVAERGAKIAGKSPNKLKAYFDAHLPLIVIGPGDVPYLVDGHHLCLALLQQHVASSVEARVEANWRDMNKAEFWKKMQARGWLYPYDNQGRGPIDPEKLPAKVTELTDDPYRSLAWAVRKRAGYTKTLDSFAEFRWANFLRTRVVVGSSPGAFDRAIEESLKYVHSPEAQALPGYSPDAKGK